MTGTPEPTVDHGRSIVLNALRAELLGPEPLGSPLAIEPTPVFGTWKDSNGPWRDEETGQEILTRDGPFKRYGVGVLYQTETILDDVQGDDSSAEADEPAQHFDGGDDEADRSPKEFEPDRLERRGLGAAGDSDDFDLTAANQLRPSAMAISFLAELPPGSALEASADCGRYERFPLTIEGRDRQWWVRRSVSLTASWSSHHIADEPEPSAVLPSNAESVGLGSIVAGFEAYTRPRADGTALVTVVLVNRSTGLSDGELYQVGFTVAVSGGGRILPYPDNRSEELLDLDPEERSVKLLYRNTPTFAIGHGCAAAWHQDRGALHVESVDATALPVVETPSITPEIVLAEGTDLTVSMAALAGLSEDSTGFDACDRVVAAYRHWIDRRAAELGELHGSDLRAGREHLDACTAMADRMADGLDWIVSDPDAKRAFQLANRAILFQQLRGGDRVRTTTIGADGSWSIAGNRPDPDWRTATGRGTWRPFQIGFLLATARSTVNGAHEHRSTVELIFFPTGGGKTEAYLGLSAFALFHQRISDSGHPGVGVLMRYTLRLLTAQQFLRASTLICAMELIRRTEGDLGDTRFSIGIWVGQSATPNARAAARKALNTLNRRADEKNPFLVLQCPWCGAGMGPGSADGPVRRAPRTPNSVARTAGYRQVEGTVKFRCPDRDCEFSKSDCLLPIYVIDEDIYEHTPSIVIGTIDKFARVAWSTSPRSLFGIRADGKRGWAPPNLVIQDELHLISGPLGSMAGLYETLIEDLCTDHREKPPRRPKIVCSTATIRQYRRQVKSLYNRDEAALFPPLGLDASDSFFARYATDDAGALLPGRMYVGVYAPGLGSGQTTIVRTVSSLLQAAKEMDAAMADPWWTIMCFFNSLRELGITVSLVQSDIPDYLKVVRNRRGTAPSDGRYPNVVKELTGRIRDDEVPAAIQELSRTTSDPWPVDICLASSMIEVGIDIPRLSLMCVVGQPKTTSQYIQVTGRVGRNWKERPGLIVTIYGATKPRDRSHFEQFTTYHTQLYAQVEPVSVTPFSKPAVRRAAHALLVGYVRQYGPDHLGPWPIPEELIDEARGLLEARVQAIDPEEYADLKKLLDQRVREWRMWQRQDWDAKATSGIDPAPLLRSAGRWYPDDVKRVSWQTPISLRDVDAECSGQITLHYADPPASS